METLVGETGEIDRISQLPTPIVHHILSFFNNTLDSPPAELVRMSVLSKTWFHLTASFPILDFSLDSFTYRESFFKYVKYTTSRFCHQNLTAGAFKLVISIREPAELDIINKCLESVLKKGVKALDIEMSYFAEFFSDPDMAMYCLPNTLLFVSVLESLTISGCRLPSSSMLNFVNFKSLIYLNLKCIVIDDEVIKHLTAGCPLLEEFVITYCDGFKRFCVYGHQNLQRVRIYFDSPVEIIDIDAPNLSNLLVVDWARRRAPPQMNLASCKKLTTVTYIGLPLPNSNGLTDFLSNFPFVENLGLTTSYKCSNLKLSSHSLRALVLHSVHDSADIEFDAPNLGLFICSCNDWDPMPMIANSPLLQSFPDGQIIDIVWFHKLRLFLDMEGEFNDLNLYIHTRKFTELEKLKATKLPPYDVKHVELHLGAHDDHAAFVDALLWCYRPRSLTLRSSSPFIDFEDVAKFTHEKLLQQQDQEHTNIQIVPHSSPETQKHFRGLMPLSGALPGEEKAVSFIKEEQLFYIS